MTTRRAFIGTLAGGLLTPSFRADAQQARKMPRIGFLSVGGGPSGGPASGLAIIEPFFNGLRELKWVEGQNLVIERRNAEGHEERLPGLAVELVRLNVDVILAAGGPASLNAAREATRTIPIVMVASSRDPIAEGLIKSYAHPGGNITGIVSAYEELTGKHLEFLKAVAPGRSRVGMLWDANIGPFRLRPETGVAARALGLELLPFEVRGPADFEGAISAAVKAKVGGLVVAGTPMTGRNRKELADVIIRHRLPAISIWRSMTEAGLLMAYGPSLPDLFRRAAVYVDKILRGAKPDDLPVERPTKFELVINLKTAKGLGITIPPSLLARVDEVIQ